MPGVDFGDVAQDPGTQAEAVDRQAVALHGRLAFGGADQIVPDVPAGPRARRLHHFMQVEERLGTRARHRFISPWNPGTGSF